MRELRDERRERRQVGVYDLADRGFDVHPTGSSRQNDLCGRDPRAVDWLTDLTAQPDGDFGDPLHSARDMLGHLVAQEGVDLAHVTHRVLPHGGFGAHRAIEADDPIDPIPTSHLATITTLGRGPKYGRLGNLADWKALALPCHCRSVSAPSMTR